MRNYWLSEYSSLEDDEMPDEETPEQDPQDPQSKLNPRQKTMYEHYEMCVEEHGMFNKSSRANGAHYAGAEKNPFIKEGLVCNNCVFYDKGSCEIVSGKIEPNAICKLWIIPEELIK